MAIVLIVHRITGIVMDVGIMGTAIRKDACLAEINAMVGEIKV